MLYKRTAHAAVELLYQDGTKITPQWPPLIGQIESGKVKNAEVLFLWPLKWSFSYVGLTPLAMLYKPEHGYVQNRTLFYIGMECKVRNGKRIWSAQNWRCELLDAKSAATYLDPPKTHGETKPQVFHPDQLKKLDPEVMPFA